MEVEAIAIDQIAHPGHGQIRILPEDFLDVRGIAVILDYVASPEQ
jgi:hypothetical protein